MLGEKKQHVTITTLDHYGLRKPALNFSELQGSFAVLFCFVLTWREVARELPFGAVVGVFANAHGVLTSG